MKESGIEFLGIKIYAYSTGIRGILERIWYTLKYKTVFLPEKTMNCGPFSYRRFMAGQFLLEERGWYKFLRTSFQTTKEK